MGCPHGHGVLEASYLASHEPLAISRLMWQAQMRARGVVRAGRRGMNGTAVHEKGGRQRL